MTTLPRFAAAAAFALALTACGEKSKTDPYLANVPDVGALTLDTSGAAPAGVAAGVTIVDPPMAVTNLQNDLAVVHEKAQAMNEALRSVFAHLEALRASGGVKVPGEVKWFGPVNRCVEPAGGGACLPDGTATLVLRVQLFGEHAASYLVVARPPASTNDGDYKAVLAGFLVRGVTERRGSGQLWVNFPNLKAAAADFKGEGYLAAGFHAGPVVKAVTYRMLEFTRDPAVHDPVSAVFTGWRNAAGVTRARVAGFADLDKTTSAEELGFWRGVWAPGFGGRAYTVVANGRNPGANPPWSVTGDLPANQYWLGRACYPPGATLPSYKEWFLCDRVADGGPVACVLHAPLSSAGLPPLNPGSHQGAIDPSVPTALASWSETTCYSVLEPAELAVPGGTPWDGPDDDRDEDAASRSGVDPMGCPSNAADPHPDTTPRGPGGGMGGGMGGMM